MRIFFLAVLLLALLAPAPAFAASARVDPCRFILGFATLRGAIPDVVGQCLAEVGYDESGNARQETSAWHGKGGSLFWRRADNWTGFTDGHRTWLASPEGNVISRLNVDRFGWEPDRLVAELRNARYRLPLGLSRGPNAEVDFLLTEGHYENREPRSHAQIVESASASGDLDGDGVADAVALLVVSSGGSGIFEYAVAMLDRGGKPVQAGYEYLGDRVKVNSLAIVDGRIVVDMITQGPNEPMCCPTQRVVKTLDLQVPRAGATGVGGTNVFGSIAGRLEGTWYLQSYLAASGTTVLALPGSTVTAEFTTGRVSGKAACNGYTGALKTDGGKIEIGAVASTRMACAVPLMDLEFTFLNALTAARSYTVVGGKLEMARADGATVLTLTSHV